MRTTLQRRVRQLHELLKPVSHSMKCTGEDATGIFMDRCSWRKKVRRRRSRRRFAEPLRDSRNQLHHTSSQPACIFVCFRVLTIGHKGGTLCSSGQGTTSGLPFYPKRLRRRSASLSFWVKFIYTAGVSLLCDMVGMCTGTSFAFCSPGSSSIIPPRTCSSPPLTPHLIQYPVYHVDLILRASIALGPSEGASLKHTHSSK